MHSKKLFMVVNVDWFFLSHRLPIALAAKQKGYDVTIMAMEEEGLGKKIESYGFTFIALPSQRGGTNFLQELKLLLFLFRKYKQNKPHVIHHVAIKPVLYGSIAARFVRNVKIINAVSGMGSAFLQNDSHTWLYFIIKKLYVFALSDVRSKVIVQNPDDHHLIASMGVSKNRLFCIDGSGVDLDMFNYTPETEGGSLKVLLAARMLRDKGILEFKEAASKLKKQYPYVSFIMAGKVDDHNISSIDENTLNSWNDTGDVTWIGHQDNIGSLISGANIIVLPSYREGLPKFLIEACAIGRPIVTTDVPGCRDVVMHNYNGLLVPVKDNRALADAIEKLILNKELRKTFGANGRALAESKFSVKKIIEKTLELYEI